MHTQASTAGVSTARTVSLPVILPGELLDRVGVAAPCEADWESMTGDDKTRHCSACRLSVHNLSMMSRGEAEAFVRDALRVQEDGGRVCIRFYRRADGTILTQDCPVGLAARARRRLRAMVVACVTIGGMTLAAVASGLGIGSRSRWLATGSLTNMRPFSDVRAFLRGAPSPPPAVLGAMAGKMMIPPSNSSITSGSPAAPLAMGALSPASQTLHRGEK